MLTLRPHFIAALAPALALLACSTEHPGGDPLYQKINATYPNLVWVASAMPAQVGTVRIKVDGKFLVWDLDNHSDDGWDYGDPDPPYVYLEGGGHQVEMMPSGAQLDLVDSAGQTVLHFEAPEPFTPPARVWVHDSPAGLSAALLDMTPDDDPTTAEVTVVNASAGERVIMWRCVGVIECEDCSTRPASSEYGEFPLSDCLALTTVGPGEQWTSKLEPTDVSTGPGAACLAVQSEGSVAGPVCVEDLNRPTASFLERSYILIDDIARSAVQYPDGTVSTYPSVFIQPEIRSG
jgi:hypothetical protein